MPQSIFSRHKQKRRTSKLLIRLCFVWLREPDLNRRPLGYEPNELPDCSIPRRQLYRFATGRQVLFSKKHFHAKYIKIQSFLGLIRHMHNPLHSFSCNLSAIMPARITASSFGHHAENQPYLCPTICRARRFSPPDAQRLHTHHCGVCLVGHGAVRAAGDSVW